MKRNLIANYTEAVVTTIFTSAVEALISSAEFVKVKGKAVLDNTLLIREAATGQTYTLEYGEETPLLDGSAGIYCTKDSKEPSAKLTITEYSFDSYSEEGEGQRRTSQVTRTKTVSLLADRGLATDYGDGTKVVVAGTGFKIESTSINDEWHSTGESDSIADRPSAADLGKGTWQVDGKIYNSNSLYYDNEIIDSSFKKIFVDSTTGYLYFRYDWSATLDAIQRIKMDGSPSNTTNGVFDFYGVRAIAIATADTVAAVVAAFNSAANIAPQTDSAAPLKYNSTYIGADHGAAVGHQITMTAHGKTSADIGSRWSAVSRTFYLLRIIDANTLLVLSNNSGTHDQWAFYTTSLSGVTLIHSSGATNTASIVVSADSPITQVMPALNNRSLAMKVNGVVIDKNVDGVYTPTSFIVEENYSIVNPADAIDFVFARVGTNPSYYDDAIASDVTVSNRMVFSSNGACCVEQTLTWHSAVTLDYVGVTQDIALTFAGKTLLQYVPGVSAIGGIDYTVPVDISGTIIVTNFGSANWLDATKPPARMAQIVALTGTNEYGLVLGYSPLRGVTTNRLRSANTDVAAALLSAATKKQYPKAITGSINPPAIGETYTAVAYRAVYNSLAVPDATVATWFIDGDDVVVVVDFHKVSALSKINLPAFCDNWAVRVIDSKAVTLLSTSVSVGIELACSATYGYAVLAVSKK